MTRRLLRYYGSPQSPRVAQIGSLLWKRPAPGSDRQAELKHPARKADLSRLRQKRPRRSDEARLSVFTAKAQGARRLALGFVVA